MSFNTKRSLLNTFAILLALFNFTQLNSQEIDTRLVALTLNSGTLEDLITNFENNSTYTFSYSNKIDLKKSITFASSQLTIYQFLAVIKDSCSIEYSIFNRKVMLEPKKLESYNIYGYITANVGNERLIGAGVMNMNTFRGSATNNYGFYSLKVEGGGVAEIGFTYLGYQTMIKRFKLNRDTLIDVALESNNILNEISVYSEPALSLEKNQMSAVSLNSAQLQKIPAFLGEVDVIKSIQMLPGIQSGSEGFGGLNVRGGGNEQNLVLIDGVTVYSMSHMLGMFSVFNSDAINNMTVLTGGFPARYGGRASSVIDLKMYEGNNKKLNGTASIGLSSIRLGFEGPAFKNKSTFSIALRRTFHDMFSISVPMLGENKWNFYFYDFYAKYNHVFSPRSRIYVSFFSSHDNFGTQYNNQKYTVQGDAPINYNVYDSNRASWGNVVGSVRWNYLLNNNLFCNSMIAFSQYKYSYDVEEFNFSNNFNTSTKKQYFSSVTDGIGKLDFDFSPSPEHAIKFGADYTIHFFQPGIELHKELLESRTAVDTTLGGSLIRGAEIQMYIEDDIEITRKLKINCGLRLMGYVASEKFYFSPEPRISLRYLINTNFALKSAYSRTSQFVHLVNSSLISLPTDLWFPVTTTIKPLLVNIFSAGYEWRIYKNITFSTELYYKTLKNVLDVKEGAGTFGVSQNLSDQVTAGNGLSYGLEMLLQIKGRKLTGWLGYSLSKATLHFDEINNGNPFPARFDRLHDVSFTASYAIKQGIDIGANWVFGTGNAVTLPSQKYNAPPMPTPFSSDKSQTIELIGNRNGYRMPNYHRLDLSASFSKEKWWGERIWSLGVYNVYGRQNPLFVYFSDNGVSDVSASRSFKQLTIFPVPIPYLRYTAKF